MGENSNNTQQSERGRAAENNANNIRNAADVAMASKNPYAMVAGGALKAADKISGGKASQSLGSAVERLNRHNPMGRSLQNASNKLSESGASDKIGQAAAAKNGMNGEKGEALKSATGGNSPKASDVGKEKLKSSSANKDKNLFRKRKKKKEENNNDDKDNNQNDDDSEESTDESDDKLAVIRKIKTVISLLSFLFPIFVVIFIILIISSTISSLSDLIGYYLNGPSDIELMQGEKKIYYEALSDVAKEFNTRCCKEAVNSNEGNNECDNDPSSHYKNGINMNYIHAALLYNHYLDNSESNSLLMDDPDYFVYLNMHKNLDLLQDEKFFENLECDINYEIGGNLYEGLSNSTTFQKLYNSYARETGRTYSDILNEVFDLVEGMLGSDDKTIEAMPETFVVENVSANKSILIKDYLVGVIYANVNRDVLTNPERLKAYTVAYTTNIMSANNITINTQSISSDSIKDITYCDPSSTCNGRGAISDIARNTVTNSINEVYGNVLVDENGKYKTLSIDELNNIDSDNYADILLNAYEGYTLRNAKEDVYDNGVNYGNEKVLTEVTFYDQTNYKSSFCGLKTETIASSGCGTTSMAIITSTYENDTKYDPVYMAEEARKQGHCSKGNGTYYGHFKYIANKFNYKYLAVKKTSNADKLNIVTSHLRKGHLIIVHVGAGHFTSGGHYMVLGGIDPETKSVYV